MRILLVTLVWMFFQISSYGLTVYFMGNSFTQNAWPEHIISKTTFPTGSSAEAVGYSIKTGSPIRDQVNDPGSAEYTTGGTTWDFQLQNFEWDVVVIQPHTRNGFIPYQDEVDAVKTVIETARSNPLNSDTEFFIFGPWAFKEGPDYGGRPYRDNWTKQYSIRERIAAIAGLDNPTAPYHEALFNSKQGFQPTYLMDIRKANPDAKINWIPVGEVVYQLDLLLQDTGSHSLPTGVDGSWDLLQDGVHLHDYNSGSWEGINGTYVSHITVLCTIWNLDPAELTSLHSLASPPNNISTIHPEFKTMVDQVVRATISRHATRYYVNSDATTGANDGSSWADAFLTVQDALAEAANTGGEIWVADGIYYPDDGDGETPGNRNSTFTLTNGIALFGGFNGTEALTNQRNSNPLNNKTVLSGDLNQDDGSNFANIGENAYHVITASNSNIRVVLDGFTITGGNASDFGGGLFSHTKGGLSISNCAFKWNSSKLGGGIYLKDESDAIFTNCHLLNNRATGAGAAGGGLYNDTSKPFLHRTTLAENTAAEGGAIYNVVNSGVTLFQCNFKGNSATGNGGAIYNNSFSPSRACEIINCAYSGNSTGGSGGAIYNKAKVTITNTSFAGNEATTSGGAIYNSTSNLNIANTIIWGNKAAGSITATSASISGYSNATITHSLFENISHSALNFTGGSNNLDGTNSANNPLFTKSPDSGDNSWTSLSDNDYGNLCLQPGSAAIDKGKNDYDIDSTFPGGGFGPENTEIQDIPIDLVGNPRIENSTIDLGAYELEPYLCWIRHFFPFASDSGTIDQSSDPDDDGLSNIEELGYGLNPLVAFSGGVRLSGSMMLEAPGLPIIYAVAGGGTIKGLYTRPSNYLNYGLTHSVQFSNNMVDWFEADFGPSIEESIGGIDLMSSPFNASLLVEGKPKLVRVIVRQL